MSYRHPCNLCGQPPPSPSKPIKKQHQKRMERAEKCCAALREWLATGNNPRHFKEVFRRLMSWMRVAPKEVMYEPIDLTETGK